MQRVEQAVARFREGFECCQAIVSTYGPLFGLERERALRIATAFGAGMARMGYTCGAVTGAMMVIGLARGKTRADDDERKEEAYRLGREFVRQFAARNRFINCRDLLGYDIGTPEGRQQARQAGLFSAFCPRLVRDAAEILEGLLPNGD